MLTTSLYNWFLVKFKCEIFCLPQPIDAHFNYIFFYFKKVEQCPYYERRGCYEDDDRNNNTMVLVFNDRDQSSQKWSGVTLNWKRWNQGYLADLLCRCSQSAKENSYKFFSIQFYGKLFIWLATFNDKHC